MAKSQKKKIINEPVSISKIYETIKAREFLHDLWWDLISDIKEKPTYKRIKKMVSSLIDDTIKDFSTEPCNDAERLKRRTMLTEISIMTYTVDTVISEVLFRKLQNEFQFIIANMIEDLKGENIASETDDDRESEAMLDNVSTNEAINKKDGRLMNTKAGQQKTGSIPSQTTPEMSTAVPNIFSRRGRPRKLNRQVVKSSPSKPLSSTPQPRKRGQPVSSPNKRPINMLAEKKSPTTSKSISTINEQTTKNISNTLPINGIKTEIDDFDLESDVESITSEGNLSMTSVSSVHTSELSSFEDTISIDGDEGNGQKTQIPLRVANDMYLQGTLSQIYEIGKRTEKQKVSQQSSDASVSKFPKQSSSADSSSLSRKILPQRARKPNSKYNSETIICEAFPAISSSSSKANHGTSLQLQPRQKRRKTSSTDDKSEKSTSVNTSPKKGHSNANFLNKSSFATKNPPTVNHTSPSTSSTKRYKSSDLNKLRSRGGTAVTLFSTLNK